MQLDAFLRRTPKTVRFARAAHRLSQRQLVARVVAGREVSEAPDSEFMLLVCQQLLLGPEPELLRYCATRPNFKYLTAFALVAMRFRPELFDARVFAGALRDPRKIVIGGRLSTVDQLTYRLLTEPGFGGVAFPWRVAPADISLDE